jgi:hypothetical protein
MSGVSYPNPMLVTGIQDRYRYQVKISTVSCDLNGHPLS